MYVTGNEGQGTTVVLRAGDSLADVPDSHRDLLNDSIRRAFADPRADLAKRVRHAPVPAMKEWVTRLIEDGRWQLALHRGDPPRWAEAAFEWFSDDVRGAGIGPAPDGSPVGWPPTLERYFQVVDFVRWMPFGCSGGLNGRGKPKALSDYYYAGEPGLIDPARTFTLGDSPCGDMKIFTDDDRGGWWLHETGGVHLLGSIADLLEWVYGELLNDRCPDADPAWY